MTTYEKGLAQGQRGLLERLVERKFGPLPGAVREQLAHWPAERLTELGDALLTAQSLRELGLEGAEDA